MNTGAYSGGWKIAYWLLLPLWIAGAAMNMARIDGGFLTNYLADLAFPPWYYILIRREQTLGLPSLKTLCWFALSRERAAGAMFLAGVMYEAGQRAGVIPGTFDWWDLAAYALGLGICYGYDTKREVAATQSS